MTKIKKEGLKTTKKVFALIINISLCLMMVTSACTSKKVGQENGESNTEKQVLEENNTEEQAPSSESTEEHGLRAVNTDGFGTPGNNGIDRIIDTGDYMYLGADNRSGTLVYRSKDKGETWEVISGNGINGDAKNIYTTTIVWFNNSLYVGTWQLESGAQLFRANADTENVNDIKWETITEDGFGNLKNNGFTNGIVFDDYIYVACFNLTEGSEMWRSKSGDPGTWEMCIPKGYNRDDNSDSTVFYIYDGYLYVGTESVRGSMLSWNGTALYRTNGGDGEISWEKVGPDGYGDKNNNNTGAITVFNGYMYVGTWNYFGMQIWRSDMKGEIPWKWERVVAGGFGSNKNMAVQGLTVVGDNIYCGCVGELSLKPGSQTGKLLTSSDGTIWTEITEEGFIKGEIIGVLWMISSNEKLYIGLIGSNAPSQLWIYE